MKKNVIPQIVSDSTSQFRIVLSAVQASLISYFLVLLPGLLSYVLTVGKAGVDSASWKSATVISTQVWLVALGGVTNVANVYYGFPVLGLVVITAWFTKVFLMRKNLRTWQELGTLACTQLLVVFGLWLGIARSVFIAPALFTSILISLLGAIWAGAFTNLTLPRPIDVTRLSAWKIYKAVIRPTVWILCLLGLVFLGLAIWLGMRRIITLVNVYSISIDSITFVVLMQLFLLPTALVWSLSWVSGPGFVVGMGTYFTSTKVVTAPLPAIPLLGALPEPSQPTLTFVCGLVVLVGMLLGRRICQYTDSWKEALETGGLIFLTTVIIYGVCAFLSSGRLGTGRMQVVGVSNYAPIVIGLELFIGILLVIILRFTKVYFLLPAWIKTSKTTEPIAGEENAENAVNTRSPWQFLQQIYYSISGRFKNSGAEHQIDNNAVSDTLSQAGGEINYADSGVALPAEKSILSVQTVAENTKTLPIDEEQDSDIEENNISSSPDKLEQFVEVHQISELDTSDSVGTTDQSGKVTIPLSKLSQYPATEDTTAVEISDVQEHSIQKHSNSVRAEMANFLTGLMRKAKQEKEGTQKAETDE